MKQSLATFFTLALLILAGAATLAGETIRCYTESCGFLYSGGTWTLIKDLPGGGSSGPIVLDIDNAGQIVGGLGGKGFVYGAGKLAIIDAPGSDYTYVTDINNTGQLVGHFLDRETGRGKGFFYDDGLFTVIEWPGSSSTYVAGLNDSGQIVGSFYDSGWISHAFLYTAGTIALIGLPGWENSASAINNSGQIVGHYRDSGGSHGFLYDGGTVSTIDPPGQVSISASDINNAGQIVGSYRINYNYTLGQHGFLYDNGTYTTIDFPNAGTTVPSGINDSGQIVGAVAFDVPEPTSMILLAGGLGAILVLRRRAVRYAG